MARDSVKAPHPRIARLSGELTGEQDSFRKSPGFADLLREAEKGIPLSEERFVQLQNAVLDPRFHEYAYRP